MRFLMVTLLVCIVSLSRAGTILSTVQSISTGNITGIVLDVKGGRIVRATVVARNKDTTRKVQTDHAGMFEVELPRGPHFHAYYQEDAGIFSIEPIELIAGSLPKRQRRLVEAWAELHQAELAADWEQLQQGKAPNAIEPLR